ncbi:TPA: heavy metal translocating P-type ATPase [Enterococcus faecium]
METIQEQQSQEKHNHNHNHDHDHDHGKMPVVLYFVGLALAVIALFLNEDYQLVQNVLFSIATISAGYHVILLEGLGETIENSKAQKKFIPNSHILMGLAAIGASLMGNFWEGTLLILIFSGANFLEDYAEGRSKREITKLLEMNPTTARLILPDGSTKNVDVSELKVGDQLQVLNGDQVPIDGLIDRNAIVNEAALTGESVPVEKELKEEVFAGTINEGNVFHIEVNKTLNQTMFSNIIRMVEEAQNKPSRIAKFIDRIESKYVIGVLIIVPIFIFFLYYFLSLPLEEAFYRGMVLLTVASPCALVASATPATLSAISNGAKNGILFKGGAAMEALSTMNILYTDKTGTLTYGDFQVVDYHLDQELLKEVIYMEQQSSHPIGRAIVSAFKEINLAQVNQAESIEEIAGSGIKKGAILVGKPDAFKQYDKFDQFEKLLEKGDTTIFVAKGNEVVGYFSLRDRIRPQSASTVADFQKEGIKVYLLTGDNEKVAAQVAKEVKVDDYISSMLPEDKIDFVLKSQGKEEVVGMIGDGINDAPALANADIGIAMGSGSSVAMESSDVVVVKNDLSKLFYSYQLSKKLNKIIIQNVIFSIAVIVSLITLNMFGVLGLPLAVLFHEGSTILVILNGLRLLGSEKTKAELSGAY